MKKLLASLCLLCPSTALASDWTVFTPSVDSRIIYVSSSMGDNTNSGLSANQPKQTISAGMTLLRNNFPDHLLLKTGDIFPASDVPSAGYRWITSGRLPEVCLL